MTWPTTPTRFILTEVDERGLRDGEDGELLSVSEYRGVIPRSDSASQQAASEDVSHYKRCGPRQLVLNRLWAFRSGLGVSSHTGLVSPDYAVYDIDGRMDPRFVHYQTRSAWFVAEMTKRLRGIGNPDASNGRAPRINTSDLGRIDMYTPPMQVQRRVADMLDGETARIDAIVAKNEQLVDALTRRFKAEAQSAFQYEEERGERRIPVQYAFEIRGGSTPNSDEENWGGDVLWATPVDLRLADAGQLSSTGRSLTAAGALSKGLKAAPVGSIVVSCRAPIGYVAVTAAPMTTNQGCKTLVPTDRVDPTFVALQLHARSERLEARGRGTTFMELSTRALAQFPLVMPPLERQEAVARDLLAAQQETERLRSKVRQQIGLLEVRRRSLVNAAVTGQIDL